MHEHVVGEPRRVQAIFTNIIENSVKYTPKGGTIRVTIAELPSEIRYVGRYSFVFEDNGIGMTQDMVQRIFEPFERESNDRRAGTIRGMGLGLPIVKNIVELMTGKTNLLNAQQEKLQSKYMTILDIQMLNFYGNANADL